MIRNLLLVAFLAIGRIRADDAVVQDDQPAEMLQLDEAAIAGVKDSNPYNRIVGGKEAKPNEFPYQVAMTIRMESNDVQVCGGVLISDMWILTAAHCLYKAAAAEVILGAHDQSNARESTQKRIYVKKSSFIIHADYPKTWTDIALLKLPVPIPFTNAIKAIPLQCTKDAQRNLVGQKVLVSGWGMISDRPGSLAKKLRYTNIQIVAPEVCKSAFTKLGPNPNKIFCAKGYRGTSTCSGDSGGPLVSITKDGKPDSLIGLVSFGMIGGCTKGYPQGFVKISSYMPWIADKTKGGVKRVQC